MRFFTASILWEGRKERRSRFVVSRSQRVFISLERPCITDTINYLSVGVNLSPTLFQTELTNLFGKHLRIKFQVLSAPNKLLCLLAVLRFICGIITIERFQRRAGRAVFVPNTGFLLTLNFSYME